MASKKRGGLSSREFAAQKAQQVKQVQKKPVSRPLSNTMDTEGYTRDIYNALPANSPAKVSAAQNPGGFAELAKKASASKQREQAAKAQKNTQKPSIQSSGSSYPGLTGNVPSGLTFGGTNTNQSDIAGGLYSGGLSAKGGVGAPTMTKTGRLFQILNDPFHTGANISQSIKQRIGLSGVDFSGLAGMDDMLRSATGIQTAEAANDPTNTANQNIIQLAGSSIGIPSNVPNNQPFNDTGNGLSGGVDPSIFGGNDNPKATPEDKDGGNNNQRKDDFDPSFMGNGEGDANLPQYQQPDYSQQQNEMYDGGQAPVDQASPRVTNQMRGSGLFGTGKGVDNPAGDDQYIKELRKAYASNGGEKWLRQQFDELIKALDPTYAQMQTEGTNALNENLRNQNNQLASVMNAGNVGDSEQRAQMMAQQQSGTQTAIGALLAKLAQGKAQDVSQYKSQYASERGKLAERNQTNQQRLTEQIQQYRQSQGRVASQAVPKAQKVSRNDVFNWVEDALGKGYSWQEIADNAQEQGIGTETGGYLDQLLNNANKQNRYR